MASQTASTLINEGIKTCELTAVVDHDIEWCDAIQALGKGGIPVNVQEEMRKRNFRRACTMKCAGREKVDFMAVKFNSRVEGDRLNERLHFIRAFLISNNLALATARDCFAVISKHDIRQHLKGEKLIIAETRGREYNGEEVVCYASLENCRCNPSGKTMKVWLLEYLNRHNYFCSDRWLLFRKV